MDAAEQSLPDETGVLTWGEIVARYPDQFVCMVDLGPVSLGDPETARTARVIGHGPTEAIAFEPLRVTRKYWHFSVRYTGECTGPIRRPHMDYDDEARKALFPETRTFFPER